MGVKKSRDAELSRILGGGVILFVKITLYQTDNPFDTTLQSTSGITKHRNSPEKTILSFNENELTMNLKYFC
jgi:hypothetical protein